VSLVYSPCRYLYLLFDDDNFAHNSKFIFTTEGAAPSPTNCLADEHGAL
jgi:hypothetical protein